MPLYLQPSERELVLSELVKQLVAAKNEPAFFATYLGTAVVGRIQQPGTTIGWAQAGLAEAEGCDYRTDGSHPLLDLLKMLAFVNAAIAAIHLRLASVPKPANPLLADTLDNGQIFLDRDAFRASVSKLMTPSGPLVLHVSGDEPKSGKWYSFKLLRFLSLNGNPIAPISIQCGPSMRAIQMAQSLLMRMNADWETPPLGPEEEKTESPLRVGQATADWFYHGVQHTGKNWWFFIKFTDTSVSADTREFVRQLAFNIANTPSTNLVRMVLVNFAGDLPPDLRKLQVREKFVLDRQAWESHALSYIARLESSLPPEKLAELSVAKQDIVNTLRGASNAEFLSVLCDELEDLTETLNA